MGDAQIEVILEEWRAVASGARLPEQAPRPRAYPLGIAGAAVATLVVLVALMGRGPSLTPGGTTASVSPTKTTVVSLDPVISPSATATSKDAGTCSADQLILGKMLSGYAYGPIGTTVVYVTQPIRNAGASCVMTLPETINVATMAGLFQKIEVRPAGKKTSTDVSAGESLSLELSARWWIDVHPEKGTPYPRPACKDPITDVTQLKLPLASDSIHLDLDPTWDRVCTSPASVSLAITK